jgi:hypothetical protein
LTSSFYPYILFKNVRKSLVKPRKASEIPISGAILLPEILTKELITANSCSGWKMIINAYSGALWSKKQDPISRL